MSGRMLQASFDVVVKSVSILSFSWDEMSWRVSAPHRIEEHADLLLFFA